MWFFSRLLLLFAASLNLVDFCAAQGNPAIDIYRKWTKQYEKDAEEAEAAAKMYSKMAKDAVAQSKADAHTIAAAEMNRVGVNTWAHSAWIFEKMFTNPKPGRAAIAAGKAAAPFNKIVGDYAAAQAAYDGTAQAYSLRVGMDQDLAKKLMTYSNQYALQGNKEMSDTYNAQATLLMSQATNFANVAKSYNTMANKIHAVIPQIQSMAGQAAGYAAYWENPTNDMPAEHVFPFTIVPPLEFAQESSELRRVSGAADLAGAPRSASSAKEHESAEVPPPPPPRRSFLERMMPR